MEIQILVLWFVELDSVDVTFGWFRRAGFSDPAAARHAGGFFFIMFPMMPVSD